MANDVGTGWLLPEVIDPPETICFKITIPDEPTYRRVLFGALRETEKWFNHQFDNMTGDRFLVANRWSQAIEEIEECMDCQTVAECIASDPDVLQALIDLLNDGLGTTINELIRSESVGVADAPIPDETLDSVLISGNIAACDLDQLYGSCVAIVDYADQANRDLLEIFDSQSNLGERVGQAIDAIPLVDELAVGDVIDMVSEIGEYTLDAYLAAYTTTLRQQMICDLFCIASQDCELTFEKMLDYYLSHFEDPLTILDTFFQMAEFIIAGTFSGELIAWIMFALQFFVVGAGSRFLEIDGVREYELQALAGDPDSDHEIFCDCPDVFEHVFDFLVEDGSWYNATFGDGWASGSGWQSETVAVGEDFKELNYIRRDFDERVITKITFETIGVGSFGGVDNEYFRDNAYLAGDESEIYLQQISGQPATQSVTAFDKSTGQSMDGIRLQANPFHDSKWHYVKCTVRGFGTDPF